jgi:hypothetical protein
MKRYDNVAAVLTTGEADITNNADQPTARD